MDESAITVRYAKALFSAAKENGALPEVKDDMDNVSAVCSESGEFNLLLKSPVVNTSEKIRMIQLIFGENISKRSLKLLEMVIRNNRETFIPSIARYVLTLIRKDQNIKTAVLTTATKMAPALLQQAEKQFEKELGTKVELSGRVNPHIIGGIILRIDDQQIDASISKKLKQLKNKMLKTEL